MISFIPLGFSTSIEISLKHITPGLTGAGFARVRVEAVVERSRSAAEKPIHFM